MLKKTTNNVRLLRLRKGLTSEELAKKLGTTHATITKLETGKLSLSDKWIERFSKALEVDRSEIVVGYLTSETEDLRKEIAVLRSELEEWKAIVVSQEGKIGRALGVAEGAAQTQGLLNKGFEARISSLEGIRLSMSGTSTNPFFIKRRGKK